MTVSRDSITGAEKTNVMITIGRKPRYSGNLADFKIKCSLLRMSTKMQSSGD